MEYRAMTDNDWEQFVVFAEKNFVASHPVDRAFMEFWFRKSDGRWTVQLGFRDDGSVSAVNMMIEAPGRFTNHLTPLTWMSTALAEDDAQVLGLGGQMLFHSHRSLPFIGCTCANENSLPINNALGRSFDDLKIHRFVHVLSLKCLNIVKDECVEEVEQLYKEYQLKDPQNKGLKRSWLNYIPEDFDELWTVFSEELNCVVERNIDYMQNRYQDAPYQQYHFLVVRSIDKELHGLSVVRLQATSLGYCARIVDFIARPGIELDIWRHTLHACKEKDALYADFFVMGTGQDQALMEAGFVVETDENCVKGIPNLLSPIDYRSWTYTFHISGKLPKQTDNWMDTNKVWFTKGDGDRDWPTAHSITAKHECLDISSNKQVY